MLKAQAIKKALDQVFYESEIEIINDSEALIEDMADIAMAKPTSNYA